MALHPVGHAGNRGGLALQRCFCSLVQPRTEMSPQEPGSHISQVRGTERALGAACPRRCRFLCCAQKPPRLGSTQKMTSLLPVLNYKDGVMFSAISGHQVSVQVDLRFGMSQADSLQEGRCESHLEPWLSGPWRWDLGPALGLRMVIP